MENSVGSPTAASVKNHDKTSVHSPSQIKICDNAAIEQVVNYKGPNLRGYHSEKHILVSEFPSQCEMGDRGFVTSPRVGKPVTANRFPPSAEKDAEVTDGSSDIPCASSSAPSEEVGELVPEKDALSLVKVDEDPPEPQVGKGRTRAKGGGRK